MTSVALPTSAFSDENVQPNTNLPASTDALKAVKPAEVAPVIPTEPAAAPIPEVKAEDDIIDEEEEGVDEDVSSDDDEDEEFLDEDDDIEEDDIDSDADETYGEQSLEGFPLSREEEAREAEELAKQAGLGSTNEALAHIGSASTKRVSVTIERYSELLGQDSEAKQLYDGLTQEINTLRSMINSGIHKVVSDMSVTATPLAVEEARSLLEGMLRQIVDRSVVHCEYRESQQVSVEDVLITLQAFGRPLYWGEQQQRFGAALSAITQTTDDAIDEDDEEDGEYSPMADEEFSDSDDEVDMETWEGKDEIEEEVCYLDRNSFKRLVDVINTWQGISISDIAYAAIQTSAEDYLSQLFTAAFRATSFAGRREIEQADIKFAHSMGQVRI